jgi:hypothetical protein
MLTIEQIQNKLVFMNLKAVSRTTDIGYNLLWKIANNQMLKIPHKAVVALSEFLEDF